MHVAVPKRPIHQFKPVQQSRQQALKAYCPNIYTLLKGNKLLQVESGVISNYIKLQYLILSSNRISLLRSKNFDRLNELVDLGLIFL